MEIWVGPGIEVTIYLCKYTKPTIPSTVTKQPYHELSQLRKLTKVLLNVCNSQLSFAAVFGPLLELWKLVDQKNPNTLSLGERRWRRTQEEGKWGRKEGGGEKERKKRRNRKRREDEEKEKMEEERRKKWKRSGEELNPVSCHLHRSNPTISTLTLWHPQLPQSPHLHIPFAAGFIIQVLEGFLRNSSTKML